MKKTIGVLLGVILGSLVVIGIFTFLLITNILPFNRASSIDTSDTALSGTQPSPSASLSSAETGSTPESDPQLAGQATSAQPDVNFVMAISSFSVSGVTSGTVVARITNTGTVDAHNSWIKVEVYSQDSLIKINGEDFFRKDLDTIKAGSTITPEATI